VFVWDIKSWPYDGVDIPLPLTPGERELQQTFVNYWTNFAKTGDPNAAGLFHWPEYDAKTDLNIELNEMLAVNQHLNSALCDFWDDNWPQA
jgi:para-nitrobenzyl esterase